MCGYIIGILLKIAERIKFFLPFWTTLSCEVLPYITSSNSDRVCLRGGTTIILTYN